MQELRRTPSASGFRKKCSGICTGSAGYKMKHVFQDIEIFQKQELFLRTVSVIIVSNNRFFKD